jgi:hypothetical protein
MPVKGFLRILILFSLFCTGINCATMFKGNKQNISVKSTPSDARVTIKDKYGREVHSCKTPCSVNLEKEIIRNGSVTIEKEGYDPAEIILGEKVEHWCLANILFGVFGIIGWGIDVSSGSWKKAEMDTIDVTFPYKFFKIDENILKGKIWKSDGYIDTASFGTKYGIHYFKFLNTNVLEVSWDGIKFHTGENNNWKITRAGTLEINYLNKNNYSQLERYKYIDKKTQTMEGERILYNFTGGTDSGKATLSAIVK